MVVWRPRQMGEMRDCRTRLEEWKEKCHRLELELSGARHDSASAAKEVEALRTQLAERQGVADTKIARIKGKLLSEREEMARVAAQLREVQAKEAEMAKTVTDLELSSFSEMATPMRSPNTRRVRRVTRGVAAVMICFGDDAPALGFSVSVETVRASALVTLVCDC